MRLNDISPADGARTRRKRRGRGVGSGMGKTAGRGHKGQKSRSGGGVRNGFEGGQMPLQRRLPKFGFSSRKSLVTVGIRLDALKCFGDQVVTLASLRKVGLVGRSVKYVKLFGDSELTGVYVIRGIRVSKGARNSIERLGGEDRGLTGSGKATSSVKRCDRCWGFCGTEAEIVVRAWCFGGISDWHIHPRARY